MSEPHELLKMEGRMIDDALRNDLDLLDRYKVQFEDFRKQSINVMVKFGIIAVAVLLLILAVTYFTGDLEGKGFGILCFVLGAYLTTFMSMIRVYSTNLNEYNERMRRVWGLE